MSSLPGACAGGRGWFSATIRPVKKTSFPTPQDCEAAFYEALEAADLEAMMEVWADDEEIICVHPGWPRLTGYQQIRENWAQIFSSGERLKVHLSAQVCVQGMMLSVHSLHENILVAGEPKARAPVVTTNVYLRAAGGWRMVVHHGSVALQAAPAEPDAPPKILH
jgi:ketosteroid isomerase-like protein